MHVSASRFERAIALIPVGASTLPPAAKVTKFPERSIPSDLQEPTSGVVESRTS